MAGRPTKYTPEAVKLITDAIRVGCTYRLACGYAGISEDTFARWRDTKADFADAIKRADAECVATRLARISKAGQGGTWQADAWTLERRYPQEYGTRTRIDINLKQEAEKIAEKHGLDVREVLAEAELIARGDA